jgi:hypothetical protein
MAPTPPAAAATAALKTVRRETGAASFLVSSSNCWSSILATSSLAGPMNRIATVVGLWSKAAITGIGPRERSRRGYPANKPACCGMLRVDQHGPRGSRAGGPRKWLRIAVRSSDEVRAPMEGTRQSMERCWMDCWAPVSEECPVIDDPDLRGPGWERARCVCLVPLKYVGHRARRFVGLSLI